MSSNSSNWGSKWGTIGVSSSNWGSSNSGGSVSNSNWSVSNSVDWSSVSGDHGLGGVGLNCLVVDVGSLDNLEKIRIRNSFCFRCR